MALGDGTGRLATRPRRAKPSETVPSPQPLSRGEGGSKRRSRMNLAVLGIETSCDETGVAVYDLEAGLRAHALYSQVELHAEYGGVVPELASRDHVRKLLPL